MNDAAVLTIDEQASEATRFTDELVRAFGLDASVAAEVVDDDIELRVEGSSLGVLVGPKGATLHALEELVRAVVQHAAGGQSARLHLDVAGYRQRRREALAAFAEQVANEVIDSGTEKALEPMNPPDRKVVHDTVAELDGVETTSVGEEPRRRVVIKPALSRRRRWSRAGRRSRCVAQLERAWTHGLPRAGAGCRRTSPTRAASVPWPRVVGGVPAASRRPRDVVAGSPGSCSRWDWPECHWLFVDAAGRRTADLWLAVAGAGTRRPGRGAHGPGRRRGPRAGAPRGGRTR